MMAAEKAKQEAEAKAAAEKAEKETEEKDEEKPEQIIEEEGEILEFAPESSDVNGVGSGEAEAIEKAKKAVK